MEDVTKVHSTGSKVVTFLCLVVFNLTLAIVVSVTKRRWALIYDKLCKMAKKVKVLEAPKTHPLDDIKSTYVPNSQQLPMFVYKPDPFIPELDDLEQFLRQVRNWLIFKSVKEDTWVTELRGLVSRQTREYIYKGMTWPDACDMLWKVYEYDKPSRKQSNSSRYVEVRRSLLDLVRKQTTDPILLNHFLEDLDILLTRILKAGHLDMRQVIRLVGNVFSDEQLAGFYKTHNQLWTYLNDDSDTLENLLMKGGHSYSVETLWRELYIYLTDDQRLVDLLQQYTEIVEQEVKLTSKPIEQPAVKSDKQLPKNFRRSCFYCFYCGRRSHKLRHCRLWEYHREDGFVCFDKSKKLRPVYVSDGKLVETRRSYAVNNKEWNERFEAFYNEKYTGKVPPVPVWFTPDYPPTYLRVSRVPALEAV